MIIEKADRALESLDKGVAENNWAKRTRAWIRHNAKFIVLRSDINFGDSVMVRTTSKRIHKHRAKQKEPMQVVEANSDLLFFLKDLRNVRPLIAHAQQIV